MAKAITLFLLSIIILSGCSQSDKSVNSEKLPALRLIEAKNELEDIKVDLDEQNKAYNLENN